MTEPQINRRQFVKTTGAVAAATAAMAISPGLPIAGAQEKKKMAEFKPLHKVNCFSEDGELKEVIFGRIDDFRLPKYAPIWDFAGAKTVGLLKKAGGQLFSEADPEWYRKASDSVDAVVGFIKERGVVVHRPKDHTRDELANFALQSQCNINLYNRDSLVTIGDTLVETSFKTPERMRNKHAVRPISMELMRNGNRVLSMPQPLDTYEHDASESPLVEGGDVEIGDGNIYIGNSGAASNSLGAQWFRTAFPDWKVHEIKISTKRFAHQHLDCVMVMFNKWGCILIDDIVGGYEGLPEPLRKKKWIELKLEEATDKLSNFIALNPEEIIMPTEAVRLRKEVEKLGIKVHHLPYYNVGKIGGSLRCNTCPIYRVG
jgi:N-dimethylarginine dimethylaminohydrolase